MFVNGTMSKFDLLRQMQPNDDLQNAWMMFDHIKCVQGWMTMGCHIYNLVYYKVMMITVYDMQSEDIESQCILWRKLNIIVEKKGLGMPIFKGFMVDGAQANWNDVCIVYGTRDPMVKMVDKKWTYFFPLDLVFGQTHQTIDRTKVPWLTQNPLLWIQKNQVLGGSWPSICYHLVLVVFV